MTETEKLIKATIERYEEESDDETFDALPVISSHENLKLAMTLKAELAKELFGQDQAITTVVNSIKNSVRDQKGPRATYLFLGPPATGKTHLAELMTKHLPKYKIMQFDMTQYHEQNGGELYGYPSGWKGYGVGQLTGFVHRNPRAIIVLDAFEKCDNVIQSNLLSIFEGGRMRDNCGWDKENIDPAIVRPGRVELHIGINDLDKEARRYFLERIIAKKPTSGDFDMKKLLMYTTGFTGSQLELLDKEASFHCLRQGLPALTQAILVEQIARIKYGERHTGPSPERGFEETAVYEAGRTVVSKLLLPPPACGAYQPDAQSEQRAFRLPRLQGRAGAHDRQGLQGQALRGAGGQNGAGQKIRRRG